MNTSVAPYLMIIKMCVARHVVSAWEEGVGQGAALPIERVPVVVQQAGKGHFDVPSSRRFRAAALQMTETQGSDVTPGL